MSQINVTVIGITLEGPNYHEWAFCMETILRGYGLLFHLTDNVPKLKEDGGNATAVKNLGINDGKVMAAMSLNSKLSRPYGKNLKQRYVQDSGAQSFT